MIITKWGDWKIFNSGDGEDKGADCKLQDWKIADSLSYFLMITVPARELGSALKLP